MILPLDVISPCLMYPLPAVVLAEVSTLLCAVDYLIDVTLLNKLMAVLSDLYTGPEGASETIVLRDHALFMNTPLINSHCVGEGFIIETV